MKEITLGIHIREGSFSDRWVEYCKVHGIPYKELNCLSTDIMEQVKDLNAVLWHWPHHDYPSQLAARQIIASLEQMGILVFPSVATCWHYDDKLAQKYLLEAIGAPLAKTWVFYSEEEALDWVEKATWPKVFKLRRGASSTNVRLVKDKDEAVRLVKKAFGKGFPVNPVVDDKPGWILKSRVKKYGVLGVVKKLPKGIWLRLKKTREMGTEKGYVMFQEFIPGASHDTRITVVGSRAWGFIRKVREGDFRASGSGLLVYDMKSIDLEMVKTSFEISSKLKAQSLAFDYVRGRNGEWRLVEISYCYVPDAVYNCPGFWDRDLVWHEGHMWPQDAVIEDILDILG